MITVIVDYTFKMCF